MCRSFGQYSNSAEFYWTIQCSFVRPIWGLTSNAFRILFANINNDTKIVSQMLIMKTEWKKMKKSLWQLSRVHKLQTAQKTRELSYMLQLIIYIVDDSSLRSHKVVKTWHCLVQFTTIDGRDSRYENRFWHTPNAGPVRSQPLRCIALGRTWLTSSLKKSLYVLAHGQNNPHPWKIYHDREAVNYMKSHSQHQLKQRRSSWLTALQRALCERAIMRADRANCQWCRVAKR